ncbi:sensor histidine kinase [Fodinicola acaciae]|uniref:sensor histidine kinase n=1 Tax=Fodinicola acaciae TaxID=2681555 RepID=UPI001FE5EB2C|nr:histidine kinase [Fodinicola acaciae]
MKRIPPAIWADAVFLLIAIADAAINLDPDDPGGNLSMALACAALIVRRRWSFVVFLLTLPAALFSAGTAAPLIALYTFASLTRRRPMLVGCVIAFAVCNALPWPPPPFLASEGFETVVTLAYAAAFAVAPALLGQFVQARRDLSAQLAEISQAQEHQRMLTTQTVLAKERAQLAREMHDVVSHQVSLIAVRAGALQVRTRDEETKEAATTIRQLAVNTLDELRHMVTVLRASGSLQTELTPQPTLGELRQLIANSGIETALNADLPDDVSKPVQRAIYRTVQEALTNVRKHAPGASATVDIRAEDGDIRLTVTNSAPTRPTLSLPGAGHGLLGLRERAELLGGEISSGPTAADGFQVRLRLPYQ